MSVPPLRSDAELLTMPIALRSGLFEGKTVLISGGGSGIGKAAAIWFARLGARVAICGRTLERLQVVEGLLRGLRAEARGYAMTIRDPEAVAALIANVWRDFGALDILVNNAGGQFPQAAIEFSVKGFQAVIETNLHGPWYMMQQAARHWRDAGQPGIIVNVVAVVERGMPGVAHTCAARAGVIHLAKTVAVEWAPLNIRVNCVAPGIIATEGMRAYPPEAVAAMPRSNPMMRFGQVEDTANAICYLASEASAFMTGTVLTVDGGFRLWGSQWTIPEPDYFMD
ncbi:MAG TPA: SDR family oxidoreductase [Acetobacteraceae bacterium]|nr:SDR family oxidoreductase [Acetobacteraceae bacterium]